MPGTKRKASFAFPYERSSKLSKRSSSTTVPRTPSSITKRTSVVKPSLKMPKFPTLKASEVTASVPLAVVGPSTTPPGLRRASTLTLEDESKTDTVTSAKSASVKRKSSATKPASLSKKSSSFVEEGALVTRLSGLRSGSIVGETSMAASTSLTKSMSRKSSLKMPSLPSGLTKLALPTGESKSGSLRVTKSTLLSDVDETEMTTALDSLKSYIKEGSQKRSSIKKNASVRSTTSVPSGVDGAEEAVATADHPHDGLMEVAISFDTTGSMYSCLEEVKAKVQDLVQRLQTDIPGIRVAVIAHGDYCDEATYIVKWIDFGAAVPEICDFVQNAGRTGGGDGPECYELVLQRSREVLTWTTGSKRVLVMIGDDVPHEPGYTYGGKTYHINWRDECAALKEMNVKVYGVQAGLGSSATAFYDEMARITGGKRLGLKTFSSIFDVLMMICYREGNPEMLAAYEQEILDRGERMADDIASLTKTFGMTPTSTSTMPRGRGKGPTLGKLGAAAARRHITVIKAKGGKKAKAKKATIATAGVRKGKGTLVKKTGFKKQKTSKSSIVQKREKLPDACMNKGTLKCIKWSKWICAVEPTMPTSKQKSKFVKIRTNHGYGLKTIFDNNFKVSAIYEVAVQTPGSRKKTVVYFRMSKGGFKRSGHWATNLLRHKKVRMEVNNVLDQCCSLYLRRGLPNAKTIIKQKSQMRDANNYIRDNFDYAWKKYIWRRSIDAVSPFGLKHRSLKISRKGKSITLSDSTI